MSNYKSYKTFYQAAKAVCSKQGISIAKICYGYYNLIKGGQVVGAISKCRSWYDSLLGRHEGVEEGLQIVKKIHISVNLKGQNVFEVYQGE